MFAEDKMTERVKAVTVKVLTFARSPASLNVGFSIGLKGTGVLLSFILFWLVSRVLGPHEFGQFSILFSLGGLLAVFATVGQHILVIRFWSEYPAEDNPAKLKGALLYSLGAIATGITVIGCAIFVGLYYYYSLVIAVSVTLYFITLSIILTTIHLVRTAKGIGFGDGIGIFLHIIFPIGYLLSCYITGREAELYQVFLFYTFGAILSIAIHLFVMYRLVDGLCDNFYSVIPEYEKRVWSVRSAKLWLANGLEAANQFVDILVVGLLMTPTVAGIYFIATRLANVFYIIATALYFYTSRHVPKFYYRKEWARLDQLLDHVAIILLVVIGAGFILMLFVGHWLLLLFGTGYDNYYTALILLCLGTAAVALAGSSGIILMLTGHEGTSLKILGMTVFLRISGFFLLVPMFKVMGAATATMLSLVFMAVSFRYFSKKLTHLDGSVTRLLGSPA